VTLRRSSPHASARWSVLIGTVVAMTVLIGTAVLAGNPQVTLPGSTFEIDTDANLKADHAIDWASVAEERRADAPSGSGDDSFGQGTKEDTAVPTIVSGSIPPNKSDLLNFGVYLETTNTGARFLNLFWHRVQEPSGTTNMDFEFNQSDVISANGVTPVRTAGDLLIQYDLSQGGTNPVLFVSEWVTTGDKSLCEASNSLPCWGTKVNLTASGDATGSINSTAIPAAESDGLGDVSPRTFGEAQLDFDALTAGSNGCTSFGSAYLKSRSSDSFTAALKDFIAPEQLNLSNCGSVIIRKETVPDESPNVTSFGFTSTLVTQPADASATDFDLMDDGSKTINNVLANTGYSVTEDDPTSLNYALTSIDCSASSAGATYAVNLPTRTVTFDVGIGETIDCTFTNTRFPKLELIKNVVNDNGGTAEAVDWTFSATGSGGFTDEALTAIAAGAFDSRASTGEKTVTANVQYTLSESTIAGYSASSWSCDGGTFVSPDKITLALGADVTCQITNDDTKNVPSGTTVLAWVVHDSATFIIRPGATDAADATITFRLYSNVSCSTEVAGSGEEVDVTISGGGALASASTVTGVSVGPGTYYWRAFYSGDQFNTEASTACGTEVTTITDDSP